LSGAIYGFCIKPHSGSISQIEFFGDTPDEIAAFANYDRLLIDFEYITQSHEIVFHSVVLKIPEVKFNTTSQ